MRSLFLNHLSKHVEDSFKRSNNHEIKDRMEMGICILNLENNELKFSGSFNPCYIISNQKMIELKAVRKQVGKNLGSKKQFETQSYSLKKNDWIHTNLLKKNNTQTLILYIKYVLKKSYLI